MMITRRTGIPMRVTTIRISPRDFDLLTKASSLEGVARAEFLRRSLKDRVQRMLPREILSTSGRGASQDPAA